MLRGLPGESAPTASVFCRLPPELIMEIIDACIATFRTAYGKLDDYVLAQTLGAFSLTSHAFLPHCQSYLLRAITLKTDQSLARFLACLEASSKRCRDEFGIGKYVKELAFFEQSGALNTWLHEAIIRLGPKLPCLSTIAFTNSPMEGLSDAFYTGLTALPPTITHLRLYFVTFESFEDLSRVILSFPHLQRLTLDGYGLWNLMNTPRALPSMNDSSQSQTGSLRSLKQLEVATQMPNSFQHIVNWLSLIFRSGTSLEELSISSHRFEARDDILAVNQLLQQCGLSLRRLNTSITQVDKKLLDTLDVSPAKNLSHFLLKGVASHIWQLVDIIEALNLLIANPSCSMTRSITSVEFDIHLYKLDRLRRWRGGRRIPPSPPTKVTSPSERALETLSELDTALANPVLEKLKNVVIRFPVGASSMITAGLDLSDTFPKMKAKADARARAGDVNWFDVRVLNEEGSRTVAGSVGVEGISRIGDGLASGVGEARRLGPRRGARGVGPVRPPETLRGREVVQAHPRAYRQAPSVAIPRHHCLIGKTRRRGAGALPPSISAWWTRALPSPASPCFAAAYWLDNDLFLPTRSPLSPGVVVCVCSYNPAKVGSPASYVSSPAWSVNSLSSSSSASSVPNTCGAPYMGSVGLPGTPGSNMSGSNYPASNLPAPMTPGAPYMNTVPLPNLQAPSTYPQATPQLLLNPLLANSQGMRFDVSQPPTSARLSSSNDWRAPATRPSISHMVLTMPGQSAFSFEVVDPNGITVGNVVEAICYNLQRNMSDDEFKANTNNLQHYARHSSVVPAFNSFKLKFPFIFSSLFNSFFYYACRSREQIMLFSKNILRAASLGTLLPVYGAVVHEKRGFWPDPYSLRPFSPFHFARQNNLSDLSWSSERSLLSDTDDEPTRTRMLAKDWSDATLDERQDSTAPQDTRPTPAPTGDPSPSTTVHIENENDFALIMPGNPGGKHGAAHTSLATPEADTCFPELVSDAEADGISFCTPGTADSGCTNRLPDGFITAATVAKADDGAWIQVTGCLDTSKFHLDPSDTGGQFDVRYPQGAQCTFGGYGASFIELVEPAKNRFCIRCCASENDQENCNSHRDRQGCENAVPGTYDFPDKGVSCSA
ncbi:hypothetical protein EVG20_g5267 [Dentipellis fragilis]|uniref:DUF6699 domain-containing protein n=1 Tax=Dentipellis fragilis TaxID=205917 RepID=A0A4Y9YTV1_9AGAM|nr:hypothetical protein EVG20_g5267 [Dentipellis fragilis]